MKLTKVKSEKAIEKLHDKLGFIVECSTQKGGTIYVYDESESLEFDEWTEVQSGKQTTMIMGVDSIADIEEVLDIKLTHDIHKLK